MSKAPILVVFQVHDRDSETIEELPPTPDDERKEKEAEPKRKKSIPSSPNSLIHSTSPHSKRYKLKWTNPFT